MGCAPCLPKKEPKGGKSGNPQRPHFLTVAVGSAAGLRARGGGGGGGERRIVVEVVEGGGTAPTKLEAEAVGGSGAAPAWEKVFEAIPLRGGGKAAARFTVFEGADFLGFASLPLSERAQMQLLARPAESHRNESAD
ncbi:hypothetical protein DIPPA_23589 [Diplonema papillatum]|nr:hypothetical protein DIPPA_23589 [Diplonema papillatum]